MAGAARYLRYGLYPDIDRGLRLSDGGLALQGKGLRTLALVSASAIAIALGMVFFYAPLDADQGFVQKIFYIHVPLAIVSLCGFVAAGIMAAAYLRTRQRVWDIRSYVAIHLSIIFGVAVLATGSLWAKASWGHWWVWDEPVLVSFLIVFLLYCTYQPLRFSIDDSERQARYASVFAIAAGAFVPLNFVAVRLASAYAHPRVLSATGGNLPASMQVTFLLSLAAVTLVFITLWKFELASKQAAEELRRLRLRLEREHPPAPSETEPVAAEANLAGD